MTTTIYGIPNCDTMKKARAWLEAWVRRAGWQTLLNRSGTTFRALPEAARTDLDEAKALALMLAQPSMIKRPVLEAGDDLLVGFKPEVYAARFGG
jgi:arsenate reductase-like glutaredoxin family protein